MITNWNKVKKNFKTESENAILVFRNTMNRLNKVNEEIFAKNQELSKEIDALQEELAENHAIKKANEKLVNNIENLLK